MEETVQHETYKGVGIRSYPRETVRKWTRRLEIAFPHTDGTATTCAYLHQAAFPTLKHAHDAGFIWGHRIIDHWSLTGLIPKQTVSRRLA